MTAAERHAIRILIDRATRAKLVADGVRAGHGARLHGDIAIGQARASSRIRSLAPARMSGSRRPYLPIAEDEQSIEAQEIELGITTRGNRLPSERRYAA